MPEPLLQNHYCVSPLQHRRSQNVVMTLRAVLVVVALFGAAVLTAGCGGRPSGQGVASLGTTTTAGPSAAGRSGTASPPKTAFAFVNCLRTHGEPNMPEPTISGGGGNDESVHVAVGPSTGVDPNSPQFTRAFDACRHLLPNGGVPKQNPISPADRADYLKAAACMRSHGVAGFPDPTFENDNVTFNGLSSLDPDSSRFKSAVARCQRLIPAGLPYSSSAGP
jgi:hypothetical protein